VGQAIAPLLRVPFVETLRRGAVVAKSRTAELISLLGNTSIVARRYVGSLGGDGSEPLELYYVGGEGRAREFEVYFGKDKTRRIEPIETLFRGNIAQFALHRHSLSRAAPGADIAVWEAFPGALAREDDVLHYPMLNGMMSVERTLTQQIRRIRSRTDRRMTRDVLKADEYVSWVEPGAKAFETFLSKLFLPYLRARFGTWAFVDDSERFRRLYARHGLVLFLAERARPDEPVCGSVLVDFGGGILSYHVNGFGDAEPWNGPLIKRRTAAVELAVMKHAIDHRFTRINLGYTRAILNDGLFVHTRRIGCSFEPVPGTPLYRVHVRPTRRAAIYARYPLLAGEPGAWTAHIGYDDSAPRTRKREWRGRLKDYRLPDLTHAIVWTNSKERGEHAQDPLGEGAFREAVLETLDLPGGVEFRNDE
jgi:hypothetical protein